MTDRHTVKEGMLSTGIMQKFRRQIDKCIRRKVIDDFVLRKQTKMLVG